MPRAPAVAVCLLCKRAKVEPKPVDSTLASNDLSEVSPPVDTKNVRGERRPKSGKPLTLKQHIRKIKSGVRIMGKLIKWSVIVVAISFGISKAPAIPVAVAGASIIAANYVTHAVESGIQFVSDKADSTGSDKLDKTMARGSYRYKGI